MGSQSCKVTPKLSDKRYKQIIMYIMLNVTLVLKLSLGAYFIIFVYNYLFVAQW